MSRHAPIDHNAARVWRLLPRPRRAHLLRQWRASDRCPYCGHRMRAVVARFEGKRVKPALVCRPCSRPDVDYRTRDRDGAAVCVEQRLHLPIGLRGGVPCHVPGFAVLDPTPSGDAQLRPADPGRRLSPGWLPFG